jgi:hypothetical protein
MVRPVTATAVVVALAVAMLLAPLQAAAVVPVTGVETIGVGSQMDLQSLKWASAECPKSKVVVGGGAAIDGAEGEVFIRSMVPGQHPVTGRHRYVVTARDAGAVSEPWRVLAFATCADPIAGLQLRPMTGPQGSDERAVATAFCGPGEQLIGMGATVNGSPYRTFLQGMRPLAWNTGITPVVALVTALEHPDGYDEQWSVTAHAVCVPDTVTTTTITDGVPPPGPARPACADLESAKPLAVTSVGMDWDRDSPTAGMVPAFTQVMLGGGNPSTSARIATANSSGWGLFGHIICAETA